MKKFFLLVAVTITLAACNNDDNYLDEPIAAQISATIGGVTTRAGNESWDDGDEIGVTMGDRYLNMKFTTKSGDGIFECPTVLYFMNKRDPLTITAYYPFAGTETTKPAVMEASTSAEYQTPEEHLKFDFLYAVKENVTGAHPNVELEFSHRMSKLTFIFKNGNDGTDVSKIVSYKIDGLILEGTFNPVTGVCAAKTDVDAKPLSIDLPEGSVTADKKMPSLIIFPQDTADKTVTLKIHDSEGQDYACELNFGGNGIMSGNNYQYTITVKKTGLSVNSTITNWTDQNLKDEAFSAE